MRWKQARKARMARQAHLQSQEIHPNRFTYVDLPSSALADGSNLCPEIHDKGKPVLGGQQLGSLAGQWGRGVRRRLTESLTATIHHTVPFPSITQSSQSPPSPGQKVLRTDLLSPAGSHPQHLPLPSLISHRYSSNILWDVECVPKVCLKEQSVGSLEYTFAMNW